MKERSKNKTPKNNCCKIPKCLTMWFYHKELCPKDSDGIANSVDPDQTAARSSLI